MVTMNTNQQGFYEICRIKEYKCLFFVLSSNSDKGCSYSYEYSYSLSGYSFKKCFNWKSLSASERSRRNTSN